MYEKTYLQGSLERIFKAIQVFGSPLQSSSPREKEKKRDNSHKALMGILSCGFSPPICRHFVCGLFIKILIIMSISISVYRPYLCDLIGPYISLVNNSIDPITSNWLTFINYIYQQID